MSDRGEYEADRGNLYFKCDLGFALALARTYYSLLLKEVLNTIAIASVKWSFIPSLPRSKTRTKAKAADGTGISAFSLSPVTPERNKESTTLSNCQMVPRMLLGILWKFLHIRV